jgi:hypothetical protein
MQCLLCLNEPILPVRVECFDCFKEGENYCLVNQRLCLFCLLDYFEMEEERRCFICRSESINKNFSFDLEWICNDKTLRTFQCPVCSLKFTSHYGLYQHIWLDCIRKCDCGEYVLRSHQKEHEKICSEYMFCNVCEKYHLKKDMYYNAECEQRMDFLPYKCPENPPYCSYCACEIVSDDHWNTSCFHRPIECPKCHETISALVFMPHFLTHLDMIKDQQEKLEQALAQTTKEYEEMKAMSCNFYESIYNETL